MSNLQPKIFSFFSSNSSTPAPAPPPKKKKTEEEKLEEGREYDANRRNRTFQNNWLILYPWLEYAVTNGIGRMHCKVCRKRGAVGPFGSSGCTSFKKATVKTHNDSQVHKDNQRIEDIRRGQQGEADKMLAKLSQTEITSTSNLVRNAHAIAMQGLPFTGICHFV
jgi:hypothetical protein